MIKSIQRKKNMSLTEKLAKYIISKPAVIKSLPRDVSFIVFSYHDTKLNKVNEKLAMSVKKEGKTIVKAQQTRSSKTPWEFTFLT